MKAMKLSLAVLSVVMVGMFTGCQQTNKAPDVTDNIRRSLDQSGYKDVSVKEDGDKGVVTLSGTVPADSDKAQVESIVKNSAGSLVVSDELAVRPQGAESEARAIDSDTDKAIE